VLEWNYLYPMEHWLIQTVKSELAEGRRSMIYFEQNAVRSMAKRIEWVLSSFKLWTLPNSVGAEDRQQAIIDAVEAGHGCRNRRHDRQRQSSGRRRVAIRPPRCGGPSAE